MILHPVRFAMTIAIIGVLGAGLTACGRRGSLEPPPSAATLVIDEPKPAGMPNKQPERRFVLDPLIE